ncbi:MAG: winged helix-turn-helix transcriptional regulator [Leptolyngbya sp. SIOISBB]|nr:winged helix-turn-helix transcriptional regulator [Leptolyngbya sp. SIOISBB]
MNTVKTVETNTENCLSGFHALSDPLRMHVIERLRAQEMCVCDLCDELEVSQSKLSFHLRVLKDAGLVKARPQGRWTYYSLDLARFVALEQYLGDYRRYSPIIPSRLCEASA